MRVILSHAKIDHTKSLMAMMQGFTVNSLIDVVNTHGIGVGSLKCCATFAATQYIPYRAIRDDSIWQKTETFSGALASSQGDLCLLAGSRRVRMPATEPWLS